MTRTFSFNSSFIINLIFLFFVSLKANAGFHGTLPPEEGNYALPTSQQPGPFLSFGQNIIDKNELQIFLTPNYFKAHSETFFTVSPSALYGITEDSSLYVIAPVAADFRSGDDHSSGAGDTLIQYEYAFYETSNSKYTGQATVVTNMTLPSGSFYKNPPTGFGAPSFFLGTTYNQMYVDWLWFVSSGAIIPTRHNGIRVGSQYLYQFGVGPTISAIPDKYILAGLLEFDGIYSEKNTVFNHYEPDTGGNVVSFTPSIWFSTPKFLFQLGVSFPLSQQLNGNQSLMQYSITGNVAWSFNL